MLIIGMIVPVLVGTVGFILIMVGRTGWDLLVYVASFAIDIGVAYVLIPSVGIRGAAIAQALTLWFSASARLFLVRRFVRIWPFDRSFLRLIPPTAIGAAVMLGASVVIPTEKWLVNLVGASALGVGAYAVALVAVGLKPGERRALLSVAKRLAGRAG